MEIVAADGATATLVGVDFVDPVSFGENVRGSGGLGNDSGGGGAGKGGPVQLVVDGGPIGSDGHPVQIVVAGEIGNAPCREIAGQYVYTSAVAVIITTQNKYTYKFTTTLVD